MNDPWKSAPPCFFACVRTLEDAAHVAEQAARHFPDAVQARYGLHELLINAVEHGNLSITPEEKRELLAGGRWLAEINHRLSLPEYRDRIAWLSLWQAPGKVCVLIRDAGRGFQRSLPAPSHAPHGRGIAMARAISFTALEYIPPGNAVLAWHHY